MNYIPDYGTLFSIILLIPLIFKPPTTLAECSIFDVPDGIDEAVKWVPIESKRLHAPSHECNRDCSTSSPMTCEYIFVVRWYYTMSLECGDCPCVVDDCNLPGCVMGDGVPRTVLTANDSLPGPAIEVCLGDRIVVDVLNHMVDGEGLSIHWHGIYQTTSPYMDGVGMITQCPIAPGTTFRYNFTADNPGTHWWHAHTGLHRTDGLFGSLIVRQPREIDVSSDLYDFDLSEHTLLLIDWSHARYLDIFLNQYHRLKKIYPPSVLINGVSQYALFYPNSDTNSNATFLTIPRKVFEVTKGYRYRFRVIAATATRTIIRFSIDSHRLTLIASDGQDIEPTVVDAFVIYPGERYDFVLEATQDVGNYWLWAQPRNKTGFNPGLAVLNYRGAPRVDPEMAASPSHGGVIFQSTIDSTGSDTAIQVADLVAREPANLPQENVRRFYITYDWSLLVDPRFNNLTSPQMNNRNFQFQSYPLLSQYDDDHDRGDLCQFEDPTYNTDRCRSEICVCTQVIEVDLNQTVEIVLIDESQEFFVQHSMHLHGHSFRVLAMEQLHMGLPREEVISMDLNGEIKRNFDHPPIKDTLTTFMGGYSVIQFVADNPGWWFFHCHIDTHTVLGQAIVIRVGKTADLPPKPDNFPRCGNFLESVYEDDVSVDLSSTRDSKSTAVNLIAIIIVSVCVNIGLVLVVVCRRSCCPGNTKPGYEPMKDTLLMKVR